MRNALNLQQGLVGIHHMADVSRGQPSPFMQKLYTLYEYVVTYIVYMYIYIYLLYIYMCFEIHIYLHLH